MRTKTSIEAGALIRGSVRNYLKNAKFYFPDLVWEEVWSFLESDFLISGNSDTIKRIVNDLEKQLGD